MSNVYKIYVKSAFDFLVASFIFVMLLPIFLIITVLLFIVNDGHAFFRQYRPGKGSKIFAIFKFKTMNDKTDSLGNLLPDEYRITKIGAFIRKYSLDELPQFINVIKGDMSLVGPRPLLPEYLPLYDGKQARRHEVKPGITGWAQVNGRNAIGWSDRFELDVWYVDNVSFWVDLRIMTLTVEKVFNKDGVSSSSSVTMEKFTGK